MTVEQHYTAIAPKLTSYLVGSGLSYATACDIVQETFLRVWRRREELLDDPAQVSGFVYTIARNLRNDYARRAKHEVLQGEIRDGDDGAGEGLVTEGSSGGYENRPGEAGEEARRLRERLNAALAQVPPLLREAFLLFQVSELSIREIARQTNASESLVKVRIHRAKDKLREILLRKKKV